MCRYFRIRTEIIPLYLKILFNELNFSGEYISESMTFVSFSPFSNMSLNFSGDYRSRIPKWTFISWTLEKLWNQRFLIFRSRWPLSTFLHSPICLWTSVENIGVESRNEPSFRGLSKNYETKGFWFFGADDLCQLFSILQYVFELQWRISESNRWPPACKAGALAIWANPPLQF